MPPDSEQNRAPLLPDPSATTGPQQSIPANALVTSASETALRPETTLKLPAILTDAGEDAVTRFVEYFTAHIRNPHTRRAYFRNAVAFLRWCEDRSIHALKDVKPVVVAGYIEQLQDRYAKPSVKQQLATIRMLFDWLVTGQVIDVNPAHAVCGPKHIVKKGKTPVRTAPGTAAPLTRNPMRTADVWRMIRRRVKQAGIRTKAGCHSFRATGITCYLENKGTLEKAQQMAAHASPRTTKLYDRTSDQVTLDEVEKIVI